MKQTQKRSIDREYSTKPLLMRLSLLIPKPGEVLLFTLRALDQHQELAGFFGRSFPKSSLLMDPERAWIPEYQSKKNQVVQILIEQM